MKNQESLGMPEVSADNFPFSVFRENWKEKNGWINEPKTSPGSVQRAGFTLPQVVTAVLCDALLNITLYESVFCWVAHGQCWGKLLLKVMRYNIAILPKKVTNYVTFYGK